MLDERHDFQFGPHLLEPLFKWFTNYSKLVSSSSSTHFIDRLRAVGKQYDRTDQPYVMNHIQSFITDYSIATNELLQQDLSQYPTFNSFFARKLLPSARPVDGKTDPSIIVSPADCRCVVFNSVTQAQQIW